MTTAAQQTRTEETTIERAYPPRTPLTPERVRELLEESGAEVHSYSGRDMYGAMCLAVTADSATDVILDAVQACAENGDSEDVQELVQMLRGSRADSMGRDAIVVYWPRISWASTGPANERNADDHDCEGDHCCSPGRGDREDFHSDG